MIHLEITPKPHIPLRDIPMHLQTEEEVAGFFRQVSKMNLPEDMLEVIHLKCSSQIHLLRLRGTR